MSPARTRLEWDERYGKLVDLSAFQRDILPLIQAIPPGQLQASDRALASLCVSNPAGRGRRTRLLPRVPRTELRPRLDGRRPGGMPTTHPQTPRNPGL
jgi:hypothetical protein